ncbi:MAG: type 4a pilus biogenesis protein PilO [Actinomycetota bacterium]
MRTKNIAAVVLAGLLLVIGWQRFVLGPMGAAEAKANRVTLEERARARTLDAELRRAASGAGKGPSARELQAAIPESPAVSSFLRAVDGIRDETGVAFQALTPSPVAAGAASPSIGVDLSVQGSWEQVRAYLGRLVRLDRLVVVDNVSLSAASAAAGPTGGASQVSGAPTGELFAGAGSAPMMSMQLTARVFTQQAPAGAVTAPGAGAAGTPG